MTQQEIERIYDMAANALQAEEQLANNSPELDKENSELIRRKAAIEALKEAFNPSITNFVKAKLAIENLPSAQPEIKTDGDTISRQAAIEAVEILLEQTEEDADVKTWNNAIRGAINSIKHHVSSAQPEQRWIPCSERLPDSKEYVLVTDYGETNMGRRFCDRWWLDCCGDKLKDVTAWMPLPEPYKEDGE